MYLFELIESISSVVYHATSFPSALKMLTADTMKTATKEISFTRSLTGSYHRKNKIMGVVFEFDGNKINQRYKGTPTGTEEWDMDTDTTQHRGKENGQLEDRVYAPAGIKNVSTYIKRAIIYIPAEHIENSYSANEFDERYVDDLKSIVPVIRQLQQASIPMIFVSSEKQLSKKTSDIPGVQAALLKVFDYLDDETKKMFQLKPVYKWTLIFNRFGETGKVSRRRKSSFSSQNIIDTVEAGLLAQKDDWQLVSVESDETDETWDYEYGFE